MEEKEITVKQCPICGPFDRSNVVLVEDVGTQFGRSIAFKCATCGLRGMGSDQVDGIEMAALCWNSLVDALENSNGHR